MSDQTSLEDLLVDEEALNEELLASTVAKYAKIGKDSGDLVPNDAYTELTSNVKNHRWATCSEGSVRA